MALPLQLNISALEVALVEAVWLPSKKTLMWASCIKKSGSVVF